MAEPGDDWTIEFFVDELGRRPVVEFLDSLDVKTRARFRWSLEQLVERNVRAREPLVKHLEGPLWELRETSKTNIYRIVYFFFGRRRIILIHGFEKQSQKTPRRELQMARKRYAEFIATEGDQS